MAGALRAYRLEEEIMLPFKSPRWLLLPVAGWVFWAAETASLTVYRIGTPFSAAEKDSLRDLGFDFR